MGSGISVPLFFLTCKKVGKWYNQKTFLTNKIYKYKKLSKMNKSAVDNFDQSVSFPMEKEYFEKSQEYIQAEQRARDAYCIKLIEQAYQEGILMHKDKLVTNSSDFNDDNEIQRFVIDEDAKNLLEFYYSDGMKIYMEMFLTFDQIFGEEEENIQVIDPHSGKVIRDNATLKDITPNSCVKVYYRDNNNNPVILTYPGLKNVTRAIQKLSLSGKYHTQYKRKIIELRRKFGDDDKTFEQEKAKILKPTEMMGDILRVSLSMKRYSDLLKWKEKIQQMDGFVINPARIKNKFCDNDVKRHQDFSEKNFRNLVVYIELPSGAKIEVQEKITSLELVDNLTHPFYESLRLEKEKMEALELTSEVENISTHPEYISSQRKISALEYTIQAINRWGIEKHNQHDVLDKVMRIEERKRLKGIKLDANRYQGEEKTWALAGMDPECVKFLQANFLARPKQALVLNNPLPDIPRDIKMMYFEYRRNKRNQREQNIPTDFVHIFQLYEKSSDLQRLFRDATPELRKVFDKYKKVLAPKYRCVIKGSEKLDKHIYDLAQKQAGR